MTIRPMIPPMPRDEPRTPGVFRPTPKSATESAHHIRLDFTADEYAQIRSLAAKHNVSLKRFCKQAVSFAIECLEKK